MNTTAEMEKPAQTKLNQLEQLRRLSKIVADTGDFATLKQYAPQDATTNPSLILKAAQQPDYQFVVEKALAEAKKANVPKEAMMQNMVDHLLVFFGLEILKIVPGRVSTETDARLSFDPAALVEKGRRFISLYEQNGIPRERILIKIASTWEGTRAAQILQQEGINCNMTLLFSLPQAIACAQVKARLISPFVGRILDWYKKQTGRDYPAAEDPGAQSVRTIYGYYKKFGYDTEVMAASFRNVGEILELAGCDLLTISPSLLAELQKSTGSVTRKLGPEVAAATNLSKMDLDEKTFRWLMNEEAMATEKTAEGIRNFNADALRLEKLLAERIGKSS